VIKKREIRFQAIPSGQAVQAYELLQGLDNLRVELLDSSTSIVVEYRVCEYTLEALEQALIAQRFHLDNSLLTKLRRALAYYSESIQRDNLRTPEHQHKTQQLFIRAYHNHPHGDRDETPVEWREYR
jgi:hypothetical protein